MRHCDIIALRWEDIRYDENGNALLSIIQKKTKEAISLPLCSEAIKHLPDRGNAPETEKVFAGLVSLGRSNVILHKWVEQVWDIKACNISYCETSYNLYLIEN